MKTFYQLMLTRDPYRFRNNYPQPLHMYNMDRIIESSSGPWSSGLLLSTYVRLGNQSRIQDFLHGVLSYYLANFPWRLHKNEKNWAERRGGVPCDIIYLFLVVTIFCLFGIKKTTGGRNVIQTLTWWWTDKNTIICSNIYRFSFDVELSY